MSKLAMFLMAGVVLACGGDSDKKKDPNGPQSEQEALGQEQLKVGVKSISNGRGYYYSFEYDALARDYLVAKKTLDQTEESVIIKVEGKKYYSYVEVENHVTKKNSRKVVLREIDIESLIRASNGSEITVAGQTSINASGNRKSFSRQFEFTNTYKHDAILCDYKTAEKDLENIFVNGGVSQKLPLLESSVESKCDGVAAVEEIQKLDLTKIALCDDNDNCQAPQDLSHLVK